MPPLNDHKDYKIVGDEVDLLHPVPPLPPDFDDDFEDLTEQLRDLPIVQINPDVHYVKKGKYASEIRALLACQGGSCPGVPESAHIIQLLGKSPAGELVFEKHDNHYLLWEVFPLSKYKRWILQVIEGLRCLHSHGLVHRDLRTDNLVFTYGKHDAIVIDLQCRRGNRLAPEVSRGHVLDAGWSVKSDIYDLGYLIKSMVYCTTPVTNLVEWPVPYPLDMIVDACTRVKPDDRPTLDEVAAMVDGMEDTCADCGPQNQHGIKLDDMLDNMFDGLSGAC